MRRVSFNDGTLDAGERIQAVASDAGLSIVTTSLTDLMAFFLGSLTILPALEWFCFFAGATYEPHLFENTQKKMMVMMITVIMQGQRASS